MKISTTNISLPPAINWATKPKPSPLDIFNHSPLDKVEEPGSPSKSRQLVPVYINPDHIADLQAALRCLSSDQQPKLELQIDSKISDAGKIETVLYIGPPNTLSRHIASTGSLPTEDQVLASSISRLFMSATPSPTSGRAASDNPTDLILPTSSNSALTPPCIVKTAPVIISRMATLRKRKYYVVLVGKCTGIFHDEWRVYFFFVRILFAYTFPFREKVEPLIRHVSNARFKGFSTYETAEEFYRDAKQNNKVKIVREPGDDQKYGPIENAVQ